MCYLTPAIPVRPENMQRLEVMAQIMVPWLGVSLVVFTKHYTTGIQSVSFNSPTDPVMAYDLYTETYLKLKKTKHWRNGPANWLEFFFFFLNTIFPSCISSHAQWEYFDTEVISVVHLWHLENVCVKDQTDVHCDSLDP